MNFQAYQNSYTTVFVQVRHSGVSELCSDVWVPQQPLEDEHSQAQHVAVALKRDQLPEDGLRTNNTVIAKTSAKTFAKKTHEAGENT